MASRVQLLFEDTSPALIIVWAQWRETQSDITQVAQHSEFFQSGLASLTPEVFQQTGVE